MSGGGATRVTMSAYPLNRQKMTNGAQRAGTLTSTTLDDVERLTVSRKDFGSHWSLRWVWGV